MARRLKTSHQTESPVLPEEPFLSEADVFPSEGLVSRPRIIDLPKDEDWESLFLPEEPLPVVEQAESPQPKSAFAYQPAPERAPTAATLGPAATGMRPAHTPHLTQPGGSRWRKGIVAAAAVLTVLVSTVLFGGRVMNRQVVPAEELQPALSRSLSPSPPPVRPAARLSRQAAPGVNPPPVRGAKPQATAGPPPSGSAAAPTRTPPPTASASREPVSATLLPASAQEAVAPAPTLTPGSLSAPPAVPPPPATARADIARAPEASPGATPAPPAPPPPAPAPAAPPVPTRISETAAVESLLTRYRSAFAALDVNAVEAFWPTVNSRALGNAFNQLQSQTFDFNDCKIDVNGPRANAICSGTASFVPTVGSKNLRVEPRRWTFHVVRVGGMWMMERVESR